MGYRYKNVAPPDLFLMRARLGKGEAWEWGRGNGKGGQTEVAAARIVSLSHAFTACICSIRRDLIKTKETKMNVTVLLMLV